MHNFRRFTALLILTVFLLGTPSAFAQKAKPAPKTAAPNFGNVEGVTAKQLKDYLTFIASDELEGRDTPSRGLDIAAMFIAQHLASWGIKPAGDNGTYFQKFPLKRSKIDVQYMRLEMDGQPFVYGALSRSSLCVSRSVQVFAYPSTSPPFLPRVKIDIDQFSLTSTPLKMKD